MTERPALIFDVEGTLIDCAAQTIECWREALAEFGIAASRSSLQSYLGCDEKTMLEALLPNSRRRGSTT